MINRLIKPLKSNSFFVFGARGTGKSTFIGQYLKNAYRLDLLDADIFDELLRKPKLLEDISNSGKYEWIFVDEIQRIPKLLNSVHRMIEKNKQKFALTGSSSRKLKRGGANLLAGRAYVNTLFPMTSVELSNDFDLKSALHWGTLPKIIGLPKEGIESNAEKTAYLRSYCHTYIKEEIQMEQVVRKLEPFREFLGVAAQSSGKIINYSSIGRDVLAQVPTVQTYFQILEDTYLGFILPHFHRSIRKSQKEAPKFYFFDLGVKKALEGSLDSPPVESTFQFGDHFETFVIQEVNRLNHYYEKDFRMSYFQTKNNAEVDLILSKSRKEYLIEIKASNKIDEIEVRKLKRILDDFPKEARAFYLSRDDHEYNHDGIECMNWKNFLSIFKNL